MGLNRSNLNVVVGGGTSVYSENNTTATGDFCHLMIILPRSGPTECWA